MRKFATGATRDKDTMKPDLEGFISPLVTKRYGAYMNKHRRQADGKMRESDNWQLGIPVTAYIKSLCRHVEDLKLHLRGFGDEAVEADFEDACCAVLFNVNGILFETLKAKRARAK